MSMSGKEYLPFVRPKARFAGQKAQEHILSVEMPLYRTYCHVSLPAFSPISVMTSWPAWAAMAGGHNRRGTQGGGRSRPTQLECGQRRPLTTESGGLLRHNIRLTRDRNWNCAGFCKVGKRLPKGPHERRGGAAARCRRHRSSGDARRRHRRSWLAPERGCHEVTGLRWRACAASAGARGYAPHKDTTEWLD